MGVLMKEPLVDCPHHGVNQFATVRGGETEPPYSYYLACMICAGEVLVRPKKREGADVFKIEITHRQAQEYGEL